MQLESEALANLLLRWDELRQQGREVSPEELAEGQPHLLPELARRIGVLRAADWIDRRAEPGEVDRPEPNDGVSGEVGRLGGRYRLDKLIAEGGSGRVWQGYDEELRRAVAVKVPRRTGSTSCPPIDFLAEGRRVAQLEHPGIVPVYDVGQDGGHYYIVLKLVQGESVADRLRRLGRFTQAEAARLVAGVARSLGYAHSQGLVHRDIKPPNVLLDAEDRPHLTDFGIALTTPELLSASRVGTLSYMSPEQLSDGDARRLDQRTDIYSLGVVLYEMLTGRQPFHDVNPVAVRDDILSGTYQRLRDAYTGASPALDRIVTKCMSVDPTARYHTAEQVAAALDECTRSPRPGRLRRRLLSAAGVLALGATILALQFSPRRPRPDEQVGRTADTVPASADEGGLARAFGGAATEGRVLVGHVGRVSAVTFHPKSGQVASAGADKSVRVWATTPPPARGRLVLRHAAAVTALGYRPDGQVLATGCEDGRVSLWGVAASEPKETRVIGGQTGPITKITFSPDGETLFSADSTGVVRVHDLTRSPPGAATLPKEKGKVFEMVAHGGGPRLTVALADGGGSPAGLHFWELGRDGAKRVIHDRGRGALKQVVDVGAVAVSSDGGTILAATGTSVACWSGRERANAIGFAGVLEGHAGRVTALAVSADGRKAVSAGDDKVVHLWDVAARVKIRSFAGHPTAVTALAISGDQTEAVSGGEDGSVRLWRLPD